MYELKDEYLTGIEMIDNEHRAIFGIADEAYELYHNEFIPDKYDYIKEILIRLKDYTLMHFDHEESYMESIHYKRMFTQKIQHDAFRDRISQMYLELEDDDQNTIIEEILNTLTDWLFNHILENDKLIGEGK